MRYPLKQFGIETGPADVGPFNATEYRVEPGREYELMAYGDGQRHMLGTCTVDGASGSLTVEPSSPVDGPGEFWAVWDVDDDQIAGLQRVLLKRDGD